MNQLKDNASTVLAEYNKKRPDLTPKEQALFDKIVEILQHTSDGDSSKILASDLALSIALTTIALHPMALQQLVNQLCRLMGDIIIYDTALKALPQFNQ